MFAELLNIYIYIADYSLCLSDFEASKNEIRLIKNVSSFWHKINICFTTTRSSSLLFENIAVLHRITSAFMLLVEDRNIKVYAYRLITYLFHFLLCSLASFRFCIRVIKAETKQLKKLFIENLTHFFMRKAFRVINLSHRSWYHKDNKKSFIVLGTNEMRFSSDSSSKLYRISLFLLNNFSVLCQVTQFSCILKWFHLLLELILKH